MCIAGPPKPTEAPAKIPPILRNSLPTRIRKLSSGLLRPASEGSSAALTCGTPLRSEPGKKVKVTQARKVRRIGVNKKL